MAEFQATFTSYTSNTKYTGQTTVTPSESVQTLATDEKLVSEDITINAIPSNYKDTTNTTAINSDILAGKIAVNGYGEVTGTIPTYTGSTTYTPTTSGQTAATNGKYVNSDIIINAIPSNYKDTTNATATANDILATKVAVNGSGDVTGTIQTYSGVTTVTPSGVTQVVATEGKYINSNITVNAVPSSYKDTTNANATASDILASKIAVNGSGDITGTIETYSGALTVTPNGETQILHTRGKYMTEDITINPIPTGDSNGNS